MTVTPLNFILQNPKKRATSAIIWLHGLGASGHDFEEATAHFQLPHTRFILPHAPVRPITINQGYEMPGWYDIFGFEFNAREDHPGVMESAVMISQLIKTQCADIPYERIIIGGFSQGAAMALYLGLTSPKKLAGVVALSGYMPARQQLSAEQVKLNRSLPIFLAHGVYDDVVPLSFGEATKAYLLQHQYEPMWKTYPMAHQVLDEEIQDIGGWLRGALSEAP